MSESSITRQRCGITPVCAAAYKKRSGAGLPLGTIVALYPSRAEEVLEVRDLERALDVSRVAARGYATWQVDRGEGFCYAFDRAKLRLERVQNRTPQSIRQIRRQRPAKLHLRPADDLGPGAPEEPLLHPSHIDVHTHRLQRLGGTAASDQLAVDQYAVTVEYDKLDVLREPWMGIASSKHLQLTNRGFVAR